MQQNRGPISKISRPERPWRDPGKRNDARELHALVYGWFTEGFETLDLKEASEVAPLDLVETVREGLLDPDLTVRIANHSAGDTFTAAPKDTPRDKEGLQ